MRLASLSLAAAFALIPSIRLIGADDARPAKATPEMLSVPRSVPAEGFQADGVKAIFFDGLPWKGKPTRVFAWVGIPKLEPGKKAPGIVLVHGGGGTAFDAWVRLWVSRGYAAIAMDTCGSVPKGTYGNWERHEAGGPPGWGGFDQVDAAITDQWPYQASSAVILAHSLLRSFPEVDADRVGLTGISWGGYLTCLVSGLDDRFKFAVPVYGCGFLGENSVWAPEFKTMGPKGEKWLSLWDPSHYLPSGKMPKLWVTGTNDFAYPMDSLKKSYTAAGGDSTLCVRLRMPHGHGGAGENPSEILKFADSILGRGEPLAKVVDHGEEKGRAFATYKGGAIAKAELLFTKDSGPWTDRKWESAPANVDTTNARASAALPEGTTVFYLNLIDEKGLVVSSPHEVVAARARAPQEAKTARDDEPFALQFSMIRAAESLDNASTEWTRQRKCGTCHTNYNYMIARPTLAEKNPKSLAEVRGFFENRVLHWDDADKVAKPKWDTEVVATAVALAMNDAQTTGSLHPLTRNALERAWTLQKADGSWDWLKCGWPPYEADNYYGATLAALGVGMAPDGYRDTPSARAGVVKLRAYFQANKAPSLHHRAMLLWASTTLDGLMSAAQMEETVQDLLGLYNRDGGWSLSSLGDWTRRDGSPNPKDAPSDGFGTGFVVYVLRQAGLPPDHRAIRGGVSWLKTHQRASGRWFTRSVNNDEAHYISNAGTGFAVMALRACGE